MGRLSRALPLVLQWEQVHLPEVVSEHLLEVLSDHLLERVSVERYSRYYLFENVRRA